jgi:hypothetical protein
MTKLVNAGNLAIWPVKTQQQVRDACPNAKFNLGHALACAWRFPGGETCWIVMVPDDQIKAAGLPVELVKRHEIAHCNGWPGDHRGAVCGMGRSAGQAGHGEPGQAGPPG